MTPRPRRRSLIGLVTQGSTPPSIVMTRVDMLRRSDEPEQAAELLRRTVRGDPALAAGLLSLLRAANRPADAEFVMHVTAAADEATCAGAFSALWASGSSDDLRVLLDRLSSRPVLEVATIAAIATGPEASTAGLVDLVIKQSLSRPVPELLEALVTARRQDRDAEVGVLFKALARTPERIHDAAARLAAGSLPEEASALLAHYARTADAHDLARLFVEVVASWQQAAAVIAPIATERDDCANLLAELGSDHYPGAFIRFLHPQSAALLCRKLVAQEAYDAVDSILGWYLRRSDAAELRAFLHVARAHSTAYRLAELLSESTGRFEP